MWFRNATSGNAHRRPPYTGTPKASPTSAAELGALGTRKAKQNTATTPGETNPQIIWM